MLFCYVQYIYKIPLLQWKHVKVHHGLLHQKYAISNKHCQGVWLQLRYINSPKVRVYTRYHSTSPHPEKEEAGRQDKNLISLSNQQEVFMKTLVHRSLACYAMIINFFMYCQTSPTCPLPAKKKVWGGHRLDLSSLKQTFCNPSRKEQNTLNQIWAQDN